MRASSATREARSAVAQPCPSPLDAGVPAAVEELVLAAGVEVAEQLVGQLPVGLGEQRLGPLGEDVAQPWPAPPGGRLDDLLGPGQALLDQRAQLLAGTADGDAQGLGHGLHRGRSQLLERLEDAALALGDGREGGVGHGGHGRRHARGPASLGAGSSRWRSPNSCQR